MKQVYIIADNILTPLGGTTGENFTRISQGQTAVKRHDDKEKSDVPFFASLFENGNFDDDELTPFELMLVKSALEAVSQTDISVSSPSTGLVLSSTKGNISLLEKEMDSPGLRDRVSLWGSARRVAKRLGVSSKPQVVSHACISGLVAMITAKRMIEAGRFENVIVAGADRITKFVLSGFQSFLAISDELCRPFDADRKGINLGEAAATVILSKNKLIGDNLIVLTGGAVSNDANHISGPSRTGAELYQAIDTAMKEAGVMPADIDFISAHGTATLYNDDMESRAFTLAELEHVPVNSLKGFYGHTLGAAGLLESVIGIESLRRNLIIPTKGFEKPGTVKPLNVCRELTGVPLKTFLKTGSGFGGCNAALVMSQTKNS